MNNNQLAALKGGSVPQIIKDKKKTEADELRHRFKIPGRILAIRSVNVSPDNRYLIITYTGNEGRIRILDLEKLEFLPQRYTGHTDSVRLTSITRDSKIFYTSSWDGCSRKYNIATGECIRIFSGFGRSPSCFVDNEQKYLFTASYDRDISLDISNTGRCWDLNTNRIIYYYKHRNVRKAPECIDIAYDQNLVFTGSDDGCGYAWGLTGGEPLIKYLEFEGTIRKIFITEKLYIAACTDGVVRSFNKMTGEHYRDFFHSQDEVRDVRVSRDQKRLYSCSADGSVKCFDMATGDTLFHRKVHSNWIWSICLMNQDNILVSGSIDGLVSFITADTGQILAQIVNLQADRDILITCHPDNLFPETGFFYTNRSDYVEVIQMDGNKSIKEILGSNDQRRIEYVNKHNLKNLIIIRLRNNNHYKSLIESHIQNQKLLDEERCQKLPLRLRTY